MLGILLCAAAPATAKEAAPVAADQIGDIRAVGQWNVNTATRAQLAEVPGLDARAIDALLALRAHGAITTLSALALDGVALAHLKTDGASTFYRLRQNPLRVVEPATATSHR